MSGQQPFWTQVPALASLFALSLLAGCGGEGGGGKTPTQPDTPKATSISLSASTVSLEAIGATQQLSVTVKDQNGHNMSGASVTWNSSNTSVATVSGAGSVTAVAVGTATISARAGTATGTASVSVTQAVSAVSITAPTETLNALGETVQYAAAVQDANGHSIPGAAVIWSSSNPDCVQIDEATGLATSVAFGDVSIIATSGSASDSAALAVVHIPSADRELLSFSFLKSKNPTLSADAAGEIDGEDVVLLIPRSVDAAQLVPTFTASPGATVEVDGIQQVDGETGNDFTAVIQYTVIAEDQSQRVYTVYVGRLLEDGEVLGWQRDAGFFRYHSDPRDIKLLEATRLHLDSTFTRIADTLHATLTDTIDLEVYPTKAAFHDKMREIGWNPQDWWIGTAPRSDWFLVVSANSPDHNMSVDKFLSLVLHEGTHSIIASIPRPGGIWVPGWLNEGLAGLEKDLVADCFPDCAFNWEYQKSVISSQGKPGLDTMFDDPSVGYAFCYTTVLFIIEKYGWGALQTFLTDPSDYSVFGLADSNAFEARWSGFLDELFGLVTPAETIAQARAKGSGLTTVEGTVTWQTQWDDRVYFLQDETAGIGTFHTDGAIPLSEGDQIRITGQVDSFRGEIQINTITEITVLGQGAVPTPRIVTGVQINTGQYQGELVEVVGSVQEVSELKFGTQRVTIRDSGGTDFPVFVDGRTGMAPVDWPTIGTTVRVIGLLGTDDRSGVPQGTGPRVEVRREEDVITVSSSTSELLAFSFSQSKNPTLSEDVVGQIGQGDVTLLIPRSVDATELIPSFTVSPGATVEVEGVEQASGETENDFTAVIRYTVIAEDQSRSTYTVYVGRLLEPGEVLGWQRDHGWFRYHTDPRDIKLLEDIRIHLDSTFTRIADTLHATLADTIRLEIYPSHAAFLAKLRDMGRTPADWWIGTAIGADWILVESSSSPDNELKFGSLLGLVSHESTHSIVASFGTPVSQWLNEGLAGLDASLLAECFPDCPRDWSLQKSVISLTGKPGLETMFADPQAGYAFSVTTVLFIVKEYGWGALQTFLSAPTDYSVFGLADSGAFEARWHDFMDELWGWVEPGQLPVVTIAEARTGLPALRSVEGTVTWQANWHEGRYFLQDETAGISAFQKYGTIPLSEGDRIRITGKVDYHFGEVSMADIIDITVLGQGTVPAPRTVTGLQINGGQYQGELVEVVGSVQEVSELEFGTQRVTIRDSGGTDFPVFVDNRTGMTAPDWPTIGTTVRVIGLLGTDDRLGLPQGTGPRVEVRRKDDVVTIPSG